MTSMQLRGLGLVLAWMATGLLLIGGAAMLGVAIFFAALELAEMLARLSSWFF